MSLSKEQRHSLANAIMLLEGLIAIKDLNAEEFYQALKDIAGRLRGILNEAEDSGANDCEGMCGV